jgi:hypothetical protein
MSSTTIVQIALTCEREMPTAGRTVGTSRSVSPGPPRSPWAHASVKRNLIVPRNFLLRVWRHAASSRSVSNTDRKCNSPLFGVSWVRPCGCDHLPPPLRAGFHPALLLTVFGTWYAAPRIPHSAETPHKFLINSRRADRLSKTGTLGVFGRAHWETRTHYSRPAAHVVVDACPCGLPECL